MSVVQEARPWDTAVDRTGPSAQPNETSGLPGQTKSKEAITNNRSKYSIAHPEQSQSIKRNMSLIPGLLC